MKREVFWQKVRGNERTFGVLHAHWAVIQNPIKQWKIETLNNKMTTCMIMHNMIVVDEQHCGLELSCDPECIEPLLRHMSYREYVQGTIEIEDDDTCFNFCGNLIEHLWKQYG